MPDLKALSDKMISAVADYVSRAVAPVTQQLAELETRISEIPAPQKGDKGDAGKDADPAFIRAEIEKAISSIPPPAAIRGDKGDRGDAGKDADPEFIRTEIEKAIAAIPPPETIRGDKGDKGDAGEVDLDQLAALVHTEVAKIPLPAPAPKGDKGDPPSEEALAALILKALQPLIDKAESELRERVDLQVRSIKIEPGEPGRDAALIDPLPSIDEAKSYSRGTWASHRGGLILATRQTEAVTDGDLPAAGWKVVVEGLAIPPLFLQGDDPRTITATCMLTSGVKAVTEFRVPMMVYCGVWKEGEHDQGDVVTLAGSAWHCQEKTQDRPGTSTAWKLMVKSGRDGKDFASPTPPRTVRT